MRRGERRILAYSLSLLGACVALSACKSNGGGSSPQPERTQASVAAPRPSSAPVREPKMARIPAGTFLMGSAANQDESPAHRVKLGAFQMSATSITVGQYEAFCNDAGAQMPAEPLYNPGWAKKDLPIVNVSWMNATAYTHWLSRRTRKKYDLPTEAEWEYAARGGKEGAKYPWGDQWDAKKCANSAPPNRLSAPAPVGSYPANGYGLRDMPGNVWEWCKDWYGNRYDVKDADNPKGAEYSQWRVVRGGSWDSDKPDVFRCAHRARDIPGGFMDGNLGFRVVLRG